MPSHLSGRGAKNCPARRCPERSSDPAGLGHEASVRGDRPISDGGSRPHREALSSQLAPPERRRGLPARGAHRHRRHAHGSRPSSPMLTDSSTTDRARWTIDLWNDGLGGAAARFVASAGRRPPPPSARKAVRWSSASMLPHHINHSRPRSERAIGAQANAMGASRGVYTPSDPSDPRATVPPQPSADRHRQPLWAAERLATGGGTTWRNEPRGSPGRGGKGRLRRADDGPRQQQRGRRAEQGLDAVDGIEVWVRALEPRRVAGRAVVALGVDTAALAISSGLGSGW